MIKASSVTLGILKSLYPNADLGAAGEGLPQHAPKKERNLHTKGYKAKLE
jgi:hypothetical protein